MSPKLLKLTAAYLDAYRHMLDCEALYVGMTIPQFRIRYVKATEKVKDLQSLINTELPEGTDFFDVLAEVTQTIGEVIGQ